MVPRRGYSLRSRTLNRPEIPNLSKSAIFWISGGGGGGGSAFWEGRSAFWEGTAFWGGGGGICLVRGGLPCEGGVSGLPPGGGGGWSAYPMALWEGRPPWKEWHMPVKTLPCTILRSACPMALWEGSPLPVNGTHACESITLLHASYAGGNKS